MRTLSAVVLVVLCGCVLLSPHPAAAQQKEFQREKLLVEKKLDDARADLKGKLRDNALKEVFAPDNKAVVAALLVVTHSGGHIKEVKVYVTRRNETGKKLVKILDDMKDPDFQTLVNVLKLGGS
jgi:hypothetical protein